jgi:hypothetical protein
MRQVPILLKDLLEIAKKLPNPDEFPTPEVAIPFTDSFNQKLNLLFKIWTRVDEGKEVKYWVLWHTIAIR